MKQDKMKQAFTLPSKSGYGGFPTTCVECGSYLDKNTDYDYASEWWISYTCSNCGIKWRYQPSDMGQSLPILEIYKSREQADKEDKEYLAKFK